MLTGLHHVQVACPAGSEDSLRAFYGGVLGMTEVTKPPVLAARGGAWFRSGGAEIHCGVEADFRPARKAHPGLLTPTSTGWRRRARRPGIRWSGTRTSPGTGGSTSPTRWATGWNCSSRSARADAGRTG